jgi:hypothetical protein
MGYTIAAYPLTLLSASIKAMQAALVRLKDGAPCDDLLVPFREVNKAYSCSMIHTQITTVKLITGVCTVQWPVVYC